MKDKKVGDPISWAFAGGFLLRRGVVVSVEKYGYVARPINGLDKAKVPFEQVVS